MFSGHLDELGFIITYIDDNGFLYFATIGGHDRVIIPGRRVLIQTDKGAVKGVTGKRAIHLMDVKDRENVPKINEMWIDIAATNKEDALSRVQVGDVATYDHEFELIHGSVAPLAPSITNAGPTSSERHRAAYRQTRNPSKRKSYPWAPPRKKLVSEAPLHRATA